MITKRYAGAGLVDAAIPYPVHRLRLERASWTRPESLPIYAKMFLAGASIGLRRGARLLGAGRALPEGAVALALRRLLRTPFFVFAHGEELTTWERHAAKGRWMWRVLRRANLVVANSNFTAERLRSRGVRAERILVLAPGVDPDRFRPDAADRGARARLGIGEGFVALSVGRLIPRKGLDTLLRATARLAPDAPDLRVTIAGDGPDRERLRALANTLGLADRVRFLGRVPDADLPALYACADVFAQPGRETAEADVEGFGIVFLEAAASGLPAIAGRAGGTADAVEDGETGFLLDGADPERLTTALRRLRSDPDLRRRLGAAARRRAVERFSWDRVASRFEEALDGLR